MHPAPDAPQIFQVDAFTREPFRGNPAGVVLHADSLGDARMQDLARELNNGDTAFVLAPDAPDHDLRVRFFTPRTEAGFVGHATLATHAVLAALRAGGADVARNHDGAPSPVVLRQKQRTGIVSVEWRGRGAAAEFVITQPLPPLQAPLAPALLAPVLEALGLQAADLDPRCPATLAGSGSTRLLIGVSSGAVLARLQPDLARLQALSADVGAPGYFLYTLQPAVGDCDTEARMFCPALGIPEDPVSGNAHAMLGALLWRSGLLPASTSGTPGFKGRQGHHLRRAGELRVELQGNPDAPAKVAIIGQAVIVFHATLSRGMAALSAAGT
ncbi:MAG TPA: PhzF family phenazine biosynthesis isomerase [Steroidobacteraceae bacterium]|nr:PhzF family phenazine biosynthesis isomerase [Steroidobacteraceae bacterium]